MKTINIYILSILALALLLVGVNLQISESEKSQFSNSSLSLYNWGDYVDPELIEKFQDETGIQVIYNTFDSNEAAYNKMKQGGSNFDVVIPSDYMISKMTTENMLSELDKEKLPNFNNLNPRFLKQSFDIENKYSVPYFWGSVGILYNTELVSTAPTSFNDLWNTEYKNNVLLVDGAREVIGMALNSNANSLNSKDLTELNSASQKLKLLAPNVKAVVGDEIKTLMASNEAAVAVIWSGEAVEAIDNNENLAYIIPEEGTNLWFDNMVIPKNAQNKEEAYTFINFMLESENAAQNADYIGYATPIITAQTILEEENDGPLDESFYPSDDLLSKMEVYENLGDETLILYNDLFLKFKIEL